MAAQDRNEYRIGPFDYDDAIHHIKKFALVLTNLGIHDRFRVSPYPRRVAGSEGYGKSAYHVILLDKCPSESKPEWLTVLRIEAAEAKGYTKPTTSTGNQRETRRDTQQQQAPHTLR